MNKPLATALFVASAGLLGWVGYAMMAGPDAAEGSAVPAPVVEAPQVLDLSPHERRLKRRLEKAKQEIEDYKAQGEVLETGVIKVPDVDGTPLYVLPELVEGVGRYGEPLYALVKYKRRAPAPLLSEIPGSHIPKPNPNPRLKVKRQDVFFDTKPGEEPQKKKRRKTGGGGKKK